MSDKVMRPVNQSRKAAIGEKQVNSAIIKGPTQTMGNLTPYNRNKSGKK